MSIRFLTHILTNSLSDLVPVSLGRESRIDVHSALRIGHHGGLKNNGLSRQ